MGETFDMNSMDEMCAMMCDNVVPKRRKNKKINKILGAMFGMAVGDALGVPVEFQSAESIHEQYGVLDEMVGGGSWGQPAGTVSDDTEMGLAVAEGIIDNPNDPVHDIGERFIKWYKGRPFDVGICCSSVIADVMRKGCRTKYDWFVSARDYDATSKGRSGGNGGLMRTAYVGCYYKDPRAVEIQAVDICGMTHHNNEAKIDCSLMSLIIHELINGGDKRDIERLVMKYDDCSERYDIGKIEGYPFNIKPSGYSGNSLSCALRCALMTRSFRDAVVMAVNMGGDTDTIGAITGAIAGALYGVEEIPEEWKKALDKKVADRIINVSMKAALNRMGGVEKIAEGLC